MKKWIVFGIIGVVIAACSSHDSGGEKSSQRSGTKNQKAAGNPSYDPNRGEGKFSKVALGATLDASRADAGSRIFNVKCSPCHKLTDEKLVGPGWKGVTVRHTAEWTMNFATNPDAMLDKDPKAQAMLELCLIRMPNQHLSDDDARNIFEFMRKNDGLK